MRRLLTILALALAGCATSGPPVTTVAPTVFVPDQPVPTLAPLGGSGIITFGSPANLSKNTLKINPSKDTFKVSNKRIAWSAELSEPAGATTLTWIVAKVSGSGVETIEWRKKIDVSNPDFHILANDGDLAFLLNRKAGTYVMRYLRDAEILAEGKFTLTK